MASDATLDLRRFAPEPYCAFFDVDGTLINTRSLLGMLDYVRRALGWDDEPWFAEYCETLSSMLTTGKPREELNAFYYTAYRGLSEVAVDVLGAEWFEAASRSSDFYNLETLRDLREHRARGAVVALVTGSFLPAVAPLASALDCQAVLCTKLRTVNGVYTGELDGLPCLGAAKAAKVTDFAAHNAIPLERCFAYGDDFTDQPMLDVVAMGHLVQSTMTYKQELNHRDWVVGNRKGASAS